MYYRSGENPVYLLVYVDDILLSGRSKEEIMRVRDDIKGDQFEMEDMGLACRVLRIDILTMQIGQG